MPKSFRNRFKDDEHRNRECSHVHAHCKERGLSDAKAEWEAHRFEHGHDLARAGTADDLRAEAAKWPQRIRSIDIVEGKDGAIALSIVRVNGRGVAEQINSTVTCAKPSDASAFYALTVYAIEKLGDPRWDTLVAEELAAKAKRDAARTAVKPKPGRR